MTAVANEIDVPAHDNPDRVYLRLIVDYEHTRVIVRPGPSGQRLPRVWPMWVALLLSQKFATSTYRVETQDNRVNVSTGGNLGKAIAMCQAVCPELHEVPEGSLIRMDIGWRWQVDWHTVVPNTRWDSQKRQRQRLALAHRFLETMPLPRSYRLSVWEDQDSDGRVIIRIRLEPKSPGKIRHLKPSLADLAKLVELHYTLAATAPM